MDARRRPTRAGSRTLWRRWTLATFLGETGGFLLPALAVLVAGNRLPGAVDTALLVLAGAGEGAVLGAAQARVLTRVLPGLWAPAWVLRTSSAAAVAWVIGLAPSLLGDRFTAWAPAVRVVVAVPAGVLLLLTIGPAQWTVLRRHVPRAGGWVAWTAAGWCAGLTVFMAVAIPLWRPGQDVVLVALIGVLAACAMALAMAAVTGLGLVRLLGVPRRQ